MSDQKKYLIRLIKKDGSKTQPADVHLDPEFKRDELQRHLIGLMKTHTFEDWYERNAKHYALEVLHRNTHEVVHRYQGRSD